MAENPGKTLTDALTRTKSAGYDKTMLHTMQVMSRELNRLMRIIVGHLRPGEIWIHNGIKMERTDRELQITIQDRKEFLLSLSSSKADYWGPDYQGPNGSYQVELGQYKPRPCPRCREMVEYTYQAQVIDGEITEVREVCGRCAREIELGGDIFLAVEKVQDMRNAEREIRRD